MGGGGTALPGLWIEKYFPWILPSYASFYSEVIVITGTNGKTTTQLLTKHVFEKNGLDCVSNSSGSNMFRGIAATIVSYGIPKNRKTILVLEVEEGTMPKIAPFLKPSKVVVTNFFRDQLDAYGELHKTVEYVRHAVIAWPTAKLYVNCDDPNVYAAVQDLPNETKRFSMGEYKKDFMYEGSDIAADSWDILCEDFFISESYFTSVKLRLKEKIFGNDQIVLDSPLIGQYNIYNLMAVILLGLDMSISVDNLKNYLSNLKTPFGRGEEIVVSLGGNSANFRIFLIKNPAGMTQVWNMIKDRFDNSDCVIALNDNIADGRDVSWIWDAKIDKGKTDPKSLFLTGTRAYDMAIRMKYAGYNFQDDVGVVISENIAGLISNLVKNDNKKYIVLATYTAMNSIRAELAKYTNIKKFS